MKYANVIGYTGSMVVMTGALLKIFHIESTNPTVIIMFGFILSIGGQEWKIKLLNEKVKRLEAEHHSGNKTELG